MDSNKELVQAWNSKDQLEQTLLAGLHGAPELKKSEKQENLGVFREQVLIRLSKRQVNEPALYPEVLHALKDKRSYVLLINGTIGTAFTSKYQRLAREQSKTYKIVRNEGDTNTGLVVASENAVDVVNPAVEPRTHKLRKLGVNEALIKAAGKKVCRKCFDRIVAADSREAINYDQLSILDRITGDSCPAHEE